MNSECDICSECRPNRIFTCKGCGKAICDKCIYTSVYNEESYECESYCMACYNHYVKYERGIKMLEEQIEQLKQDRINEMKACKQVVQRKLL